MLQCWLVVEPYPSEKYEFVSWDEMKFPTEWKNKTCSKPPTSILSNGFIPYIQWIYPLLIPIQWGKITPQ